MSRWLALVIAVALWPAVSHASVAPLDIPAVTISGGGLPHAVQLASVDADAFRRRINRPPRLKDAPVTAGPSYTVASSYWMQSFTPDKDLGESDASSVAEDATYYPEGGYVLTRVEGKDAWLVIDLRQRAILDRYIRLTLGGAIGEQPTVLQVLASAAKDETFGVQIGGRTLTQAETTLFWSLVAALTPLPKPAEAQTPQAAADDVWITVTLAEGRTVRFLYSATSGTLANGLGDEVYAAPRDWLTPILGPYDPQTLGEGLDSAVEQQKPAGSKLWWPVMIGGGLLAIGLAVWWQRRSGGPI